MGLRNLSELDDLSGFLRLILDNVYCGIIVCDTNLKIVFMNRVYGDLLKTDPKEAVGRSITDFFPQSRLWKVLEDGHPELGRRCSLKTDTTLLVNRIPIEAQGRIRGVILQTIFKDYQDFTDLVNRMNVLEREVKIQKRALDRVLSTRYSLDSIIGASEPLKEVKTLAGKYAKTDSPVLILGATGTGKELFAHGVHSISPRSNGPFVCVNCAGIPRDLLESELFGYEGGAFTGARKDGKVGQIELANKGTLYLDEIGELPLSAQSKLLRVLEQKVFDKVGGVKPMQVDFRLVAATNRDLKDMMNRGEFREDLYYRLSAMILNIPTLSERVDDIPVLVQHFLNSADHPEVKVSPEALTALKSYDWPGNIRELKNTVDRALSLAESAHIELEHLPSEVMGSKCGLPEMSGYSHTFLVDELARYEREILCKTLALTGGNMSRAAKRLGISRSTLYEKCRKFQVNSNLS
jgi:transcriptional regulator with PAS, ATPase and Fis domain